MDHKECQEYRSAKQFAIKVRAQLRTIDNDLASLLSKTSDDGTLNQEVLLGIYQANFLSLKKFGETSKSLSNFPPLEGPVLLEHLSNDQSPENINTYAAYAVVKYTDGITPFNADYGVLVKKADELIQDIHNDDIATNYVRAKVCQARMFNTLIHGSWSEAISHGIQAALLFRENIINPELTWVGEVHRGTMARIHEQYLERAELNE